jgi:hypothetical protein
MVDCRLAKATLFDFRAIALSGGLFVQALLASAARRSNWALKRQAGDIMSVKEDLILPVKPTVPTARACASLPHARNYSWAELMRRVWEARGNAGFCEWRRENESPPGYASGQSSADIPGHRSPSPAPPLAPAQSWKLCPSESGRRARRTRLPQRGFVGRIQKTAIPQ